MILFLLNHFLSAANEEAQKYDVYKNASFNTLNFDFDAYDISDFQHSYFKNHGKTWTHQDEQLLNDLCEEGKSFIEMIHRLQRKPKPIENRMAKLGWHFVKSKDGSIDLYHQSPITNKLSLIHNYNPKHILNARIRFVEGFISDKIFLDFAYPILLAKMDQLSLNISIGDKKMLSFINGASLRSYKIKLPKNISDNQVKVSNKFLGSCTFNLNHILNSKEENIFLYEIISKLDTSKYYEHS